MLMKIHYGMIMICQILTGKSSLVTNIAGIIYCMYIYIVGNWLYIYIYINSPTMVDNSPQYGGDHMIMSIYIYTYIYIFTISIQDDND